MMTNRAEKMVFVFMLILACMCSHPPAASALNPARDWDWAITEVWDNAGHKLAQGTGNDPLSIIIDPTLSRVKLYATIFNNQALNSSNIDFRDIHTYGEKAGEGSIPFFNVYGITVAGSWTLDSLLPIPAGQNKGPFWVFDVYLKDAPTPAPPGTYRIFNSAIDIYDLNEPLNQFGNHTLYSIEGLNEVSLVTAVPEPAQAALLILGSAWAWLFRRKT